MNELWVYEGLTYRVVIAHTTQSDWLPPAGVEIGATAAVFGLAHRSLHGAKMSKVKA